MEKLIFQTFHSGLKKKRKNSEILDTQEYLPELPKPSISVRLKHSMLVWISFDLIISTSLL